MRVVACLNGDRSPGDHPTLPVSAEQLAADARAVMAAGATALHVHPRDGRGNQALEPQVLTPVLGLLREAAPGIPLSVTTSLRAEPDPWRRFDLVGRWGTIPDSAVVDLEEPGAVEIVRLLDDRRVPVEARVSTVTCARILLACGLEISRVIIEPTESSPEAARATVARICEVLRSGGVDVPCERSGAEEAAWPLLDDAIAAGEGLRIGLGRTLYGPNGEFAQDNAALVADAVARQTEAQRTAS
jgi:uncharacterized protein (DUF849 family)